MEHKSRKAKGAVNTRLEHRSSEANGSAEQLGASRSPDLQRDPQSHQELQNTGEPVGNQVCRGSHQELQIKVVGLTDLQKL